MRMLFIFSNLGSLKLPRYGGSWLGGAIIYFGEIYVMLPLRCCMVVVSLCCEVLRYSRMNRHNPDLMLTAYTSLSVLTPDEVGTAA